MELWKELTQHNGDETDIYKIHYPEGCTIADVIEYARTHHRESNIEIWGGENGYILEIKYKAKCESGKIVIDTIPDELKKKTFNHLAGFDAWHRFDYSVSIDDLRGVNMAKFEQGNELGEKFKAGEKQTEIARKGGIASGESKREKKSLKSALLALLEAEHKSKSGEVKTGFEVISIGLYNKAMKGDAKAIKLISELIGEYKLRTDLTSGDEKLGLNISVTNPEVKEKLEQLADELGKNK